MDVTTVLFAIAGVLFAAAALIVLYRVIAGPSLLDRVIASDVLLTTLILVVGAEMVINQHTRTVPLMVVLAATAILGSVSVSRFVSRPEAQPGDDARALSASGETDDAVADEAAAENGGRP